MDKSGCIRTKWLYSGNSGCTRAKWLYSGKVVKFEQKKFIFCILAKGGPHEIFLESFNFTNG